VLIVPSFHFHSSFVFLTITCSLFSCPITLCCSSLFLKTVASEWFINFFHSQYHWLQNLASTVSEWICASLYFMFFHFSTCLSEIEILFYNRKYCSFNPFLLFFLYRCYSGQSVVNIVSKYLFQLDNFLWLLPKIQTYKLIYLCTYNNEGPWVDSAPNRNEYQWYLLEGKGNLCVGLKTLPPSCVLCL
jgi:hypothetical protein